MSQPFHCKIFIQEKLKAYFHAGNVHGCLYNLFVITESWKQPKYPLTDEWISKPWHSYTVEYNSVIQRIELSIHAVTDESQNNYSVCKKLIRQRSKGTMQFYLCKVLENVN